MSNLDDAIKGLAKQGIETASAAASILNLDRYSTGLLSLDYILSGGFPKGRVMEIFGFESSGKSSLCLIAIAAVQKAGKVAALVDLENSYDPKWAGKMGVDSKKLLIFQPNCGEDGLTAVDKLAATGEVDLIVIDSLAALLPKAEIEAEFTDHTIGLQARLLSKALRKLSLVAARSGTTIIFINQLRYKVGVVYGDPTVTPGGMALKFYASIRLKVTKKDKIKTSTKGILGHKIRIDVVKSKVSAPFVSAEARMLFDSGIDSVWDTFSMAHTAGIITKNGITYEYNGQKLGVGLDSSIAELRKDPVLYDDVYTSSMEALQQMLVRDPNAAISKAVEPLVSADVAEVTEEKPVKKPKGKRKK